MINTHLCLVLSQPIPNLVPLFESDQTLASLNAKAWDSPVYGLPLNCKGFLSIITGTGLLPYIRSLYERFYDLSDLDEICAYRPYRFFGLNDLRDCQVFDTPV